MKFRFVLRATYSGPVLLRLNGVDIDQGTKAEMLDLMHKISKGIEAGVSISLDEEGAY